MQLQTLHICQEDEMEQQARLLQAFKLETSTGFSWDFPYFPEVEQEQDQTALVWATVFFLTC